MDTAEILRLAGTPGRNLEKIFDTWIDTGKFDEDKIIIELDELKFSGLPLEVYSHFVSVYNSIKEFDLVGYLRGEKHQ
jgi:hypothetical protein